MGPASVTTCMDGRHMRARVSASLLREAVEKHGVVIVRARGGSMGATIPDGAVVEIRALSRAPQVGDILAVQCGDELVIHRLVRIVGDELILMGDANGAPDRGVPKRRVIGRVDGSSVRTVLALLRSVALRLRRPTR